MKEETSSSVYLTAWKCPHGLLLILFLVRFLTINEVQILGHHSYKHLYPILSGTKSLHHSDRFHRFCKA